MFSMSTGMANVYCYFQHEWPSFLLSYEELQNLSQHGVHGGQPPQINCHCHMKYSLFVIPDLYLLDAGCVTFQKTPSYYT